MKKVNTCEEAREKDGRSVIKKERKIKLRRKRKNLEQEEAKKDNIGEGERKKEKRRSGRKIEREN
jgi:hypothetical protein